MELTKLQLIVLGIAAIPITAILLYIISRIISLAILNSWWASKYRYYKRLSEQKKRKE